jgi:hypothetical protein
MNLVRFLAVVVSVAPIASCTIDGTAFVTLPVETRVAFINFSQSFYASLGIRESGTDDAFTETPLLAPGATFRDTFLETVGSGCPDRVDLRLFLYARTNGEVPIGLDDVEAVDSTPIVAGETLGVPACEIQAVETYTIVNWEADLGVAQVKIAQGTVIEDVIREDGFFDGPDGTWEIVGVEGGLADVVAPILARSESLSGSVILADGSGVADVGVLLRTRFRVRSDDADPDNDPDAGFGAPIAFTSTDDDGRFSFDRPAGAYEVEFFSDDFAFRPASVIVESPIDVVTVVAEPIAP